MSAPGDDAEILLNCTACHAFRPYDREKENVVKCAHCGKRHSDESLMLADPDTQYARDESGALLEEPP